MSLALVLTSVAVQSTLKVDTYLPDQACVNCEVLKTCNSLACKTPHAIINLNDTTLQLKTMETGLAAPNKYLFEHLLGAALRQTPAAIWAVNTFISRVSTLKFNLRNVLCYSVFCVALQAVQVLDSLFVLSCSQCTIFVVTSCGCSRIVCKEY